MLNLQINDKLIIGLLTFLGIGGLVGGLSFISRPDGSGLGMNVTYLSNAPVDNYFWPGVFLLVFMCFWPLINAYGLLRKKSWLPVSLILLGIVSIVWIIFETVIIRTFSPLQPTIFLVGFVLCVGGFARVKSIK